MTKKFRAGISVSKMEKIELVFYTAPYSFYCKRVSIYLLLYLLFSRYLHFCLDFLVMKKNGLIRRTVLISKLMTSQPGKQIITIHMLPNIARSKGNQTVKFGQLIEFNNINISLRQED